MWCPHCQSDVPHLAASSHGGQRRCLSCGRSVGTTDRSSAEGAWRWQPASDEGLDLSADSRIQLAHAARSTWDDWTLAAEVRSARRIALEEPGRVYRRAARRRIPRQSSGAKARDGRRPDFRQINSPVEAHTRWYTPTVVLAAMGIAILASGACITWFHASLGMAVMLWGLVGLALGALVETARAHAVSRKALARVESLESEVRLTRQLQLLFDEPVR